MKKTFLTLILLPFFLFQSFSQNFSEEYNYIQKFIESTVQIPFMARVADVQGVVGVRITINSENNMIYEVEESLRPDCNLEAIRVVKLINLRNLKKQFQGKQSISIEVPFHNNQRIKLEDGYVLEYFNEDKKPTIVETEIKFVRKYLADTLTGSIQNNPEYLEVKKDKFKRVGIAFLMIDSSGRNIPTLFENETDSVKKYIYSAISIGGFPNIYFETYKNGQLNFKELGKTSFYYYANGRVKSISEEIEVDSEKVINETNWYANGQVSSVNTYFKDQPSYPHKYIAVWDTLGKKTVENGEGLAEFYSKNSVESGIFKNGFKDGLWIEKSLNGTLHFKEIYEQSNLLEGTRYVGQDSIKYNLVDNRASFIGGMKGFGKHLMTTLKYPIDAIKAGSQGTVLIEFTVCTDGTLCDYNILRGVDENCNKEALRVIKLTSGKWKSAKKRGIPVSTKFTLPVTFQSLGIINR